MGLRGAIGAQRGYCQIERKGQTNGRTGERTDKVIWRGRLEQPMKEDETQTITLRSFKTIYTME